MRFLLVGNYGVKNLGDDALREYFIRSFAEVEWQVVCRHPRGNELPALPAGIRSLLFSRWWRTRSALKRSDGLVFGGGTLFTDTESLFAGFIWWVHCLCARHCNKPYFLAFQGIGPFRTKLGAWFCRSALAHASFVSVRDEASKARALALSPNTIVIQTFDPVFALLEAGKVSAWIKKYLIVIPRQNSGKSFFQRVEQLAGSRLWEGALILSLAPEDSREQLVCRRLEDTLASLMPEVVPVRSLSDLEQGIARGTFVLSQRYHGALAAIALGKEWEVVPQREGDKLSQLRSLPGRELLLLRVKEGENALREALNAAPR